MTTCLQDAERTRHEFSVNPLQQSLAQTTTTTCCVLIARLCCPAGKSRKGPIG